MPGYTIVKHWLVCHRKRVYFNELYRQMNGMPLREMDQIIYPVCRPCRDHERAGFVEGIKIGMLLQVELTGK